MPEDFTHQSGTARSQWVKSLNAQYSHAAYSFCSVLYTHIPFLNEAAFDVVFSSIQLSQDLKVGNGEQLHRKIPVPSAGTGAQIT